MANTHFFFALALPEETKQELKTVSEALKVSLPFKKCVHPLDYHITLAFLGAATPEQLQSATSNLRQLLTGTQSIPLNITHIKSFGSRILWAGIEDSATLRKIQQQTAEASREAGFQLESRAFTPHITLARRWSGEVPFQSNMLHQYQLNIPFTGAEVVLYQTHLDRTPKYEKIEVIKLSASKDEKHGTVD